MIARFNTDQQKLPDEPEGMVPLEFPFEFVVEFVDPFAFALQLLERAFFKSK